MALQDTPGTAVFPPRSRWGHFVFSGTIGKDPRQCIKIATIVQCMPDQSPTGWKADMKKLHETQIQRGSYSPQLAFPLEEVPALISALVKEYEAHAMASAPAEARQYASGDAAKADEARRFTTGSSEF